MGGVCFLRYYWTCVCKRDWKLFSSIRQPTPEVNLSSRSSFAAAFSASLVEVYLLYLLSISLEVCFDTTVLDLLVLAFATTDAGAFGGDSVGVKHGCGLKLSLRENVSIFKLHEGNLYVLKIGSEKPILNRGVN